MYRTTYGIKLEEFEVLKSTEKSIWFINKSGKQDRELRHTDSYQWHETKQAAIDFLLKKYIGEKKRLENRIAQVSEQIEAIKAL